MLVPVGAPPLVTSSPQRMLRPEIERVKIFKLATQYKQTSSESTTYKMARQVHQKWLAYPENLWCTLYFNLGLIDMRSEKEPGGCGA